MVYTAKRKFSKKPTRRPSYKKKRVSRKASIQKIVKQVVNRNLETKQSNYSAPDGQEIFHNNFITTDLALLQTSPGVTDPMATETLNRIGDEIMLKGVSLKFMLELNERYSDVTFRILVVKCAKGDTPTRATLFVGLTGNKMMDNINTERYTIVAQKFTKLQAPNMGSNGGFNPPGSGHVGVNSTSEQLISRATRIVKMWIPGTKFGRGGKIRYEDGGTRQKFFDYHVLVYAYSNYSTLQDVYYVGRLNEYTKTLYYKDA